MLVYTQNSKESKRHVEEILIYTKRKGRGVTSTFQTEDKVHGIRRGFFNAKAPQIQYLSGIEALFLL